MDKIVLYLIVGIVLTGCTKENFIDTGLAVGYQDCSMLEYMKNNPGNWDSTVVMIEHAGLEKLFDGKDPDYPKFTFFGPKKLSLLRYLLDNDIERINDMDPEECREMILEYVCVDLILRKDVPKGTASLPWPPIPGEGGMDISMLGGNACRLFARTQDYEGLPEAGATYIYLESRRKTTNIATSDLRFTNGIIHALATKHTFGSL